MATLDEIYTAAWFAHDFEHLQPEFDVVADSLVRQFAPRTAVDLGCGPGMVVGRLRYHGVSSFGYDGSSHALAYATEDVRCALECLDITKMARGDLGKPDLAICTEVAEHLDEKHAAGLVALLCSAMCPIVFTAAPPGQDGHHHVNCQPMPYWQRLFNDRGVILDREATLELACRWSGLQRLSHMAKNVAVFR